MAAAEIAHNRLWVVESNGAPRSGKGTITNHLAQTFPGAAQDETGADYRAVTWHLLDEGHLDPEMDSEAIGIVIETLGAEAITEYAAARKSAPEAELYEDPVGSIVGSVSPFATVRKAVKDGFRQRVEKQVADDETSLLFVDGRNLTPVIESIEGADLLLRIFVDCQPFVAAFREAKRQGKSQEDPDFEEWYQKTVESIQRRQRQDEERKEDPVKKEDRAIDYWYNNALLTETAHHVSETRRITFSAAAKLVSGENSQALRRGGREGAGAKALAENRQVYFDTSEIDRDVMLSLATRMTEEALDHSIGNFQPRHDGLFVPQPE